MNDNLFGLQNFGQTCYINSILQCLFNIPNFVGNINWVSDNNSITNELKYVYEKSKINKIVAPVSFCKQVFKINENFDIHTQNDAHEFLNFILDNIHEETKLIKNYKIIIEQESTKKIYQIINNIKLEQNKIAPNKDKINNMAKIIQKIFNENIDEYFKFKICELQKQYCKLEGNSIISNNFLGFYESSTKCSVCKTISNKYEHFLILSLDLIKDNIEDCIKNFTKTEYLKDDNQYFCDKCNNYNNAVKKLSLLHLPKNLIIHLKRFEHKKINNNYRIKKIDKEISFDIDNLNVAINNTNYNYSLRSVCCHIGGCNFGHYYANIKKDTWFCANDKNISPANEIISNSYILFYSR